MEVRIGSIESALRALSYLREHCRNGLCAFDANLVPADVEVGQWGAEHIKPNRNAEKRVSVLASDGAECMPFCS